MPSFINVETFLVYSALTNFTQKKRKTYDANDLLALYLVSTIVYIYSLGNEFYCTYLKTTEHELKLSCTNIWTGKCTNNLQKCGKKKKKKKKTCERFLNTFNRWYENKEKTNVLLVL